MLLAPYCELGWQPDMPDWRDWTAGSPRVTAMQGDLAPLGTRPKAVSWREFIPAIDQESAIPSSTRVCVLLLESTEQRVNGYPARLSGRFVHRAGLRYAAAHAGNPLSLRQVWKTIVQFGVPAGHVWPGPERKADPHPEPDAFAYLLARKYSELAYLRLDARPQTATLTLEILRAYLAAGFLFVCGFPQYSSLSPDGEIGFPTTFDVARGGHAVLAVGYDDDRRLRSDRGCFQVCGQWGREWGDAGFGWLPYSYIRKQLAVDFWTVLHPRWLASGEFRRPTW